MESLDERERELIEEFSRRMANKFLHNPTVRIKELSTQKGSLKLMEKLFLDSNKS